MSNVMPKSIKDYSLDELDALIDTIRERRLKSVRIYEESEKLRHLARIEGLEVQYDKQLEMFRKELERVDKHIDRLELRTLKLRAIRLEIEQ